MPAPDTLRGLIAVADEAEPAGTPSLSVPSAVQTELPSLLGSPCAFAYRIEPDGLASLITPALRTLAAMRDPVADAHSGWLLAVAMAAEGRAIATDPSLTMNPAVPLTPEGRAWLAAQAIEIVRTDAQRSAIVEAIVSAAGALR